MSEKELWSSQVYFRVLAHQSWDRGFLKGHKCLKTKEKQQQQQQQECGAGSGLRRQHAPPEQAPLVCGFVGNEANDEGEGGSL